MRNLLFISFIAVSLNLSAQKTSYGQLWESIETAEQQGEFKSLQPQLKAIYSKAKKEKNQQQAIKALLHLSRIRWETDDDDINRDYAVNLAVFNDFRSEIEQATGIEKLILQDYLAQMYAQYAQSIFNSYKNTTTVPSDSLSTDIRLWSKERYHKEITTLFETILANPDLLKNTPTENYATLLKNSEYNPCFPTLFDIFVADYLGYLNSFSRVHPTTFRNTRYGKISELYMQLADFHRNDADLTAWLHAKVQLITTRNRGNEAQAALELEALADANINQPYAAEVLYQAAQQLRNQSYTFYKRGISRQGTDPNLERNLHRLYTKALTEVPDSPWNAKAKNALTALEQKKITPSIPQFALPNQPIPLHISHLNADTLTFTLFRINTENVDFNKKPIWSDNSEFNSFVPIFDTEVETLYTKSLPIKKFNDYRTHAAYYSLEPLPKGSYTIQYIACGDTSSAFFAVSDILPVIQPTLNSEETIISFVNRKTGDPIKNQPFQLIEIAGTDSDDNTMPYWIVRNEGKTDKQGYYRTTFKRFNGEWPYLFNFPQLNEIVYIDINPTRWNTRPTPQKKQTQRNIEFFTDRAIYRPGQTVRCKGILSEVIDDKVSILPDSIVTIQLLDANGKVLQTVTRTANEFGSVEASFILPDMPVGNYALRSEGTIKGYKTFNVEEYKRPKFEVTINPSDRQYTLGQRVKVNGKAQSYAGAPLSNAEVTYTVTRSENWPWRTWDFFYMPTRSNEWEPIAQGEFSINPDGTFDFYFNAEAYNDTRNTNPRSYRYTVTVDVTDVNGETQSSSSHINVGTYPKTLALTLPQQIFESEPFIALLTSQNLNGLDTPSQGTVTVTRLLPDTPERPLLPNNQLTIDYQNLPYNEFTKLFPFIAYSEADGQYTKRGDILYQTSFNTQGTDSLTIPATLPYGEYLIEAFTLYGTDTIKAHQTFSLLNKKTGKSKNNLFFDIITDKETYQVGDKAHISFISDFSDGIVYLNVERQGTLLDPFTLPLKKGRADYILTISPDDLNNPIAIRALFVKEGGYAVANQLLRITLPEKNRLNITTSTFRNKLTPGQPETWQFTISGTDKDKLMSEVVATLYDASLDKFANHQFRFTPHAPVYYNNILNHTTYNLRSMLYNLSRNVSINLSSKSDIQVISNDVWNMQPQLNWFKFEPYDENNILFGAISGRKRTRLESATTNVFAKNSVTLNMEDANVEPEMMSSQSEEIPLDDISPRRNLQETAFFYPQIRTDEQGNFTLSFTSPEALTRWKLLLFAHNKNLEYGTAEFTTVTQKELMVTPNAPRFLRQGDTVTISTKIDNLSNQPQTGQAQLLLFDVRTGLPVDSAFANSLSVQPFQAEPNSNTQVSWTITVPRNAQPITYRIVAASENFSDGEENLLPVLTNQTLVTETRPIFVRQGEDKTYAFNNEEQLASPTLQSKQLTLQLTPNPTWLALLSLPYIDERETESSQQLFARLYANTLAADILTSSPQIEKTILALQTDETAKSPLLANPELKNILLEETPWLLQAESEAENANRMADFFNAEKLANNIEEAAQKLAQNQNFDGGFSWFPGGKSNNVVTLQILTGLGRLKALQSSASNSAALYSQEAFVNRIMNYVDATIIDFIEQNKKKKQALHDIFFIQYLYARAPWMAEYPLPDAVRSLLDEWAAQPMSRLFAYPLNQKAMAALALHRYGYEAQAQTLIRQLKETAVSSPNEGTYWKTNVPGWRWYQTPVETQAILIEAFNEITPQDTATIDEMKLWLLKNRHTNAWPTSKATTEATYALVNSGTPWDPSNQGLSVTFNNEQIFSATSPDSSSAAGYIKQTIPADSLLPSSYQVRVEKQSEGTAWGSLYWQYLEDMDKVNEAASDIKLQKQLFLKQQTPQGPILVPITEETPVAVGAPVTVRLIVSANRDLEFIHLKDMRAAGLEPMTTLSQYNYQNGVGYYQTTRDAATHIFFDYLPKGTHLFEYDLRANNAGNFMGGITTLQSIYAPELAAHTKGHRIFIQLKVPLTAPAAKP